MCWPAGASPTAERGTADLVAARLSEPARRSSGPEYTCYTRNVYSACMARVRTNIEIDDVYVEAIKSRYGIHTKTEAVDLALRHLAGQPMTREQALAMRGVNAMGEVPADTGPGGAG